MKKSLVLMAMAGVALAGCVNDVADVAQKEQEKVKIAFESPVMYNNNSESRAKVFGEIGTYKYGTSTYSYPRTEDFQIYAIQHTGDFEGWDADNVGKKEGETDVNGGPVGFNDTKISWDEQLDGWVPFKLGGGFYYWPDATTTKMSFAACSPAVLDVSGATRTYGATGLTINDFQIAADASKQYDLLFSKRSLNMVSTQMNHVAGKYSGIPIQFQHALSSISFSVFNKSSEELILTKVTVYGTEYKGAFNENINNEQNGYITEGTDKNVNPKWTNSTERVAQNNAYVAFQGAVIFPTGNAQYVADIAAEDTDAAGENEICNMLLLLPQTLTNDIKIHVEYTVNGHPASKTVSVLGAKNTVDESVTVNSWEVGTRYTYRLYYSAASADKDRNYFAPSTDEWNDAGAYIIELL